MRNLRKYLGITLVSVILSSSLNVASAQNGKECAKRNVNKECKMKDKKVCSKLNLTEEQQTQFDKLKLDGDKKILPIKNSLNELKAKKQTLMSASTVDKDAVNKVIKEMNDKQEQIQLIRTEQHIAMRNILTEEQRVKWDSMKMNKNKGHKNNKAKNQSKCCK